MPTDHILDILAISILAIFYAVILTPAIGAIIVGGPQGYKECSAMGWTLNFIASILVVLAWAAIRLFT